MAIQSPGESTDAEARGESLLSIWKKSKSPATPDSDATAFREIEAAYADRQLRGVLLVSLGLNFVVLPIEWLVATGPLFRYMVSVHLMAIAFHVIALGVGRFRVVAATKLAGIGCAFWFTAFGGMVSRSIEAEGALLPETALGHCVFSAAIIVGMARSWASAGVILAIMLPTTAWLVRSTPDAPRWIVIYGAAMLVYAVVARIAWKARFAGTRHACSRLAQVAPLAVVRQAVAAELPLEKIFPSMPRQCICVSLAWYDFEGEALTSSLDALATKLNAYYEQIDAAMRATASTESTFLDATADEIFIVAYETETLSLDRITEDALDFTTRLLELRAKAAAREPALVAGISVGTAWVGVVGPETHRKTTALGECPGHAARLRAMAKRAGSLFGAHDRIAVLPATLAKSGRRRAWQSRVVDEHLQVKDLNLDVVAFLGDAA